MHFSIEALDCTYLDKKYLALAYKDVPEENIDILTNFILDLDMSLGGFPQDPNDIFRFPYGIKMNDFERCVSTYLLMPDSIKSNYFDWTIVGTLIQAEYVAFMREMRKTLPTNRFFRIILKISKRALLIKAEGLLNELEQLATETKSISYSLSRLTEMLSKAESKGCYIHPALWSMLADLNRRNITILNFPPKALTPSELEAKAFKAMYRLD